MSSIKDRDIVKSIRETLGLPDNLPEQISESYVTQAKKYDLNTEFLSTKTKKARQKDLENHVKGLNTISAKLDTASRDEADKYASEFRQLKIDETHLLNAALFRSYHFENISDLQSQLTMDTMTFLRLERDFGSFDDWQKDFIACGMSSRSGYVVTGFNTMLKRYLNVVVDIESVNVPVSTYPVIVLDVSEGAYYRDYLGDRKTYIVAMMKELNWEKIEDRFKRAEKLAKVFK
jgi:superoxide dismutase, Fe-Mn family